MHYWFKILSVTALSCYRFPTTAAQTVGSCSFSSYDRFQESILRGNVVSQYEVPHGIECRKRCAKTANCLSLNILKNSDGGFLCQLNKARKEDSPSEQFVKSGGNEYYEIKKRSLCKSRTQGCDSEAEWHTFNQSHFKLINTAMTWHNAREFCQKGNGDLASIASEEEFQFLYENFIKDNVNYAYIGFNDIESKGNFVWSDGTVGGYSKFYAPPDNHAGNEHCVIMNKDLKGEYGDLPCSYTNPFLCKMNKGGYL